jgi:hypothetical protein
MIFFILITETRALKICFLMMFANHNSFAYLTYIGFAIIHGNRSNGGPRLS